MNDGGIIMAITTINAHVNRALDFFNKPEIWFAIGKNTAWTDDTNPPTPDPSTSSLLGLIGFKKIDIKYMVVPDPAGTIVYRNNNWRIVPSDQASSITAAARWVYLEANLLYDELPLGYYRQVGVYTGLVRANGVSTSLNALLPSQVSNNGILEVVDNRQPSNRQIDQKDKLTLVIEC